MDKLEKNLRNLLSSILIPKFTKKDKKIIVIDAKNINLIELTFSLIISENWKKSLKFIDQYIIWKSGNKKLIKKIKKQNKKANKPLELFKVIFLISSLEEFEGLWNLIFFLE